MPRPPSAPLIHLRDTVRLGHVPEVLAADPDGVRPDGVGPITAAAAALHAAEAALREGHPRLLFALRHVELQGGLHRLVFALHPAGGPITLTVDAQGGASLLAHTALAGPGYHRFVIQLARDLAPVLGASWRPRVPRDLEARFLSWLQHQAREALTLHLATQHVAAVDRSAPPAVRWLAPLSPQVGHFQGRGAVATVVGPRPEAWLQAVVADPRAGRDAFPWWEPGPGVTYRIGRARCLLWRELRWRPPTTEEEVAALSEVANLLAEAWEEEPDRQDLPWAAWAEVLDLLGEAPERRARVAARVRPGPLEGYRRYPVVEELPGGWSITLPGRMGSAWDPAEGWVAWDEGRTAWVTPLTGEVPEPDADEGVRLGTVEGPDRQARLLRLPPDEEGRPTEVLTGHVRAGEAVAAVTLAWQEDPAGRAWAEAAFRSLRRG